MTLPANIRVNVRAPFPTQVKGASFISVSKANGVWTITPNYLVLGQNINVSPTQVIALQDQVTGVWSFIGAALFAASALSSYRVVTTAGAVNILSTDIVILLEKSPSGTSTINLPASATRAGAPVAVKDLTGDANANNVTFVPFTGETIDGFSAAAAAANGVALIDVNYGFKKLFPLAIGGWYVGS